MTYEEALPILKSDEGPRRAHLMDLKLKSHLLAKPGGVSVRVDYDHYHGLSQVTRTPRRKSKMISHGRGRTVWVFDDAPEVEFEFWSKVMVKLAERIQAGHYTEPEEETP